MNACFGPPPLLSIVLLLTVFVCTFNGTDTARTCEPIGGTHPGYKEMCEPFNGEIEVTDMTSHKMSETACTIDAVTVMVCVCLCKMTRPADKLNASDILASRNKAAKEYAVKAVFDAMSMYTSADNVVT